MTKGYLIFEWSPGISITDEEYQKQIEEDKISSSHEDEHDDDITENGEYEESIKEETYKDEHISDRLNDPSNYIIKNQDKNDQGDATIENDGPEKMIEDKDMEQPEEI